MSPQGEEVPQLSPTDKLSSHEEQIVIPLPPQETYSRLNGASLEKVIPGTDRIPAVVGTKPLNETAFPNPGARRRVMLADNSAAIEEVIQNKPNEYFSYKVWDYTIRTARPIEYGKGEFWYLAADDGQTILRWRYSFKLRNNRFPGMLGPLGRLLFTKFFLDRTYAPFMKSSLEAVKRYALRSEAP